MTLELVIPETDVKNRNTKDLVFSVLIEEESKTLTQLHREIKRRYGISVTFQAVIKAINSLLAHKVIIKEGKVYSLSKDWVFETRNFFDRVYTENFKVKKPMKRVELGKEITLYTVSNLLELDRLWNDLLVTWTKKETEDKRNVWKGRHCWWLIPRLQEEDILHDLFAKHNIKTYNLLSKNTALDKITVNYYKSKKEFIKVSKNIKLDSNLNLSSFGEYLVKFEIPKEVSGKLEKIYKNTRNNKNLDLKRILDIFKENCEIEVTVMKNKFIANKIKDEVVSYFK